MASRCQARRALRLRYQLGACLHGTFLLGARRVRSDRCLCPDICQSSCSLSPHKEPERTGRGVVARLYAAF